MQMETFHWKKNQQLAEDYIAQTDKAKAIISLPLRKYGRLAVTSAMVRRTKDFTSS